MINRWSNEGRRPHMPILKAFLKGLLLGAGFTIAMIAVSLLFGAGWMQWTDGEIRK